MVRSLGGVGGESVQRSLGGLVVPRSTAALTAARSQLASADQQPRRHAGVVQTVTAGRASVLIGGDVKWASITPTAKAIQSGDAVSVEKRGGAWWIVAVDTWHEPPVAAAPSAVTPTAASTVSGQTVAALSLAPQAPGLNVGSVLSSVITWAESTRAHLIALEAWHTPLRTQVNRLRDNDVDTRAGVNNNAGRQNDLREVTTSTRDATVALREGAIQDRIVQ